MRDVRRTCRIWVILGAALVGCGLIAQPAAAQPGSDVNAQTAVLYRAGVKAAEENRLDDARAFFLAAWRVKQYWQIAANLADAEAATGRYRDAAEHFEFALRTGQKELSPQEKQRIEALLAQARAKVGTLTVEVDALGAEVLVDGALVGKAPLLGPLYVEPGARTIEARREGYAPESEKLQVAAGSSGKVALKLERLAAGAKGRLQGDAAGDKRSALHGDQATSSSAGAGPNRGVLIAGVVLTTVGLGVGVTSLGIAMKADTTDGDDSNPYRNSTWHQSTSVGIGSFAVAGAIGFATGIYAIASSGSKTTTEAKTTVRVGAYPGGVVVTGAF